MCLCQSQYFSRGSRRLGVGPDVGDAAHIQDSGGGCRRKTSSYRPKSDEFDANGKYYHITEMYLPRYLELKQHVIYLENFGTGERSRVALKNFYHF